MGTNGLNLMSDGSVDREIYKMLPDGSFSRLSLNSFMIWGIPAENGLAQFNGIRGGELLSGKFVHDLLNTYFSQGTDDIYSLFKRACESTGGAYDKAVLCMNQIAKRLSALLYSLKFSVDACRSRNPDVLDTDWRFWKNCRKIYFVSGIMKGKAGEIFDAAVARSLWESGIRDIKVSMFNTEVTPSLIGCALMADREQRESLVFDFGQSFVKSGRARFVDSRLVGIYEYPRIPVPDYEMKEEGGRAEAIHQNIVNIITNTYDMASARGMLSGGQILICISNNIIDGVICSRGYYSPLRVFQRPYDKYLEDSLGQRNIHMHIRIVNDVQAVANLFQDSNGESAVISLGTHLGIAYPGNKMSDWSVCIDRGEVSYES